MKTKDRLRLSQVRSRRCGLDEDDRIHEP